MRHMLLAFTTAIGLAGTAHAQFPRRNLEDRGRDTSYLAPPAQIRTCPI